MIGRTNVGGGGTGATLTVTAPAVTNLITFPSDSIPNGVTKGGITFTATDGYYEFNGTATQVLWLSVHHLGVDAPFDLNAEYFLSGAPEGSSRDKFRLAVTNGLEVWKYDNGAGVTFQYSEIKEGYARVEIQIFKGATLDHVVFRPQLVKRNATVVTVSKDGKTKTKTAGADGVAVFKGLKTGEWTVTITDGEQTAQKPVTITADYSTSITFFSATIHVTYPAGSTCTATDGVTTLMAPDTSGMWGCVVPNAGAWTVSITNNAGTKSKSVSITADGQTASCILGAPSAYREVVYIQSTGTQYINPGLTGKTYRFRVNTKVNIEGSSGRLYGDNYSPYNMLLWSTNDGITPMSTYNGAPFGDKIPLGETYIIDRACSPSGVVTVKNGSNTIATYDASNLGFDTTKTKSPFIFCYNGEGSPISYCKAKLYWMTIYDTDGTTLLREFVPCYRKSDSVAGLYDLVNDVFYTNAGSGTFVVGGDV